MPSAAEILEKMFHPAKAQAEAEVQESLAAEKNARMADQYERKVARKNQAFLRKSGVHRELKQVHKLLREEYPDGDFQIEKQGPGAISLLWGKGEDGVYDFGISIKASAEAHSLTIATMVPEYQGGDELLPWALSSDQPRGYLSKIIADSVLIELKRMSKNHASKV